jgi:CheY-like chemotaxis protein
MNIVVSEKETSVRKRAIILDDEYSIRHILGHILSSCGYSVTSYSSPAEEAIFCNPDGCPMTTGRGELFDECPSCAELIITDINMPFISGIEFVRRIRGLGCRARHVAIMSGIWSEELMLEAEALGCKTFCKPFSMGKLREWVSSLVY